MTEENTTPSTPRDIPSVYHELGRGISLLWSNDFEKAEEFFARRRETSPRHALHYAEVMVFRSVITELATDRKVAIDRLDATISIAESHYKAYSEGKLPKNVSTPKSEFPSYQLDARIVTADAYTILAALQILEEARVKGFLNLRKAWRIYKETMANADMKKADPMVVGSLKFGAGLFYFIISMIPPGIAQKAASLAGFKGGDKQLGLQYLKDCYNGDTPRSHLAGMVLMANNLFLDAAFDPEHADAAIAECDKILQKALNEFPKGSLFQAFASLAALERNKVDEAISLGNQSIANCAHITQCAAVFLRNLSNCHAMKYDWQSCFDVIGQVMEKEKQNKSKNVWSFPWNAVRSGACSVMLNDAAGAKKFFTIGEGVKASDSWSEMIKLQSGKFLNNGGCYSMLELMLLTGHIQKITVHSTDEKRKELIGMIEAIAEKAPGSAVPLAGKKVEKSLFSFKKAKYNDVKVDNRVAYLVLRATVEFSLGNDTVADTLTSEVINFNFLLLDKMYYVLALIIHSKCMLQAKNKDQATKDLQTAAAINDYAWESSLKSQIRKLSESSGVEAKFDDTVVDAELNDDETLKELMAAEEDKA